jgi:hypothetical protein
MNSDKQQLTFTKGFSLTDLYNITSLDFYLDKIPNNIQITFKLYNLNEIRFSVVESDRTNVIPLCRILNVSPNLKILHLDSQTPKQFIDLLKLLPIVSLKNLTKLKLSSGEILLNSTFIIGLAQIISSCNNIKHLCLFGIKNHKTSQFLTSKTIIDHMENYFHNIIHLDLSICSGTDKEKQAYHKLKQWLNQSDNELMTTVDPWDAEMSTAAERLPRLRERTGSRDAAAMVFKKMLRISLLRLY